MKWIVYTQSVQTIILSEQIYFPHDQIHHVTESHMDEKSIQCKIDQFQNLHCKLTFKKRPLVKFAVVLKKNTYHYLKRLLKYNFLFQHEYLWKASLYSSTSAKTIYHERLKTELDIRIHLFSIKPDSKSISKIKKTMPLFTLLFILENIEVFHKIIIYSNM